MAEVDFCGIRIVENKAVPLGATVMLAASASWPPTDADIRDKRVVIALGGDVQWQEEKT